MGMGHAHHTPQHPIPQTACRGLPEHALSHSPTPPPTHALCMDHARNLCVIPEKGGGGWGIGGGGVTTPPSSAGLGAGIVAKRWPRPGGWRMSCFAVWTLSTRPIGGQPQGTNAPGRQEICHRPLDHSAHGKFVSQEHPPAVRLRFGSPPRAVSSRPINVGDPTSSRPLSPLSHAQEAAERHPQAEHALSY